ncbi:MAG: DUF983 domain-containing protein [Beijerinckiaceae bacterium]
MTDNGPKTSEGERSGFDAALKGFRLRCPHCGEGKLFKGFLKPVPECSVCHENLEGHRSDDLPPYVTIFIVGHLIVPLILANEMSANPWPLWVHAAVWLPLTLIVTLLLMPRVKGAIIGMQWGLRLHGFDPQGDFHSQPLPASARPKN